MRQLVYKVSYTRNKVPFYLWWMETVLKLCKILKYCEDDCAFYGVINAYVCICCSVFMAVADSGTSVAK